jgi:hypothetical protein
MLDAIRIEDFVIIHVHTHKYTDLYLALLY